MVRAMNYNYKFQKEIKSNWNRSDPGDMIKVIENKTTQRFDIKGMDMIDAIMGVDLYTFGSALPIILKL